MAANSEAMSILRANVIALLKQRGEKIQTLADALEMSRPGLSRMLNNHRGATISTAEKIAGYFGIELADLITKKKFRISA